MSQSIRIAVVGVGALGKEHARIYAELARTGAIRLTGVFDTHPPAADQVAARLGVPVLGSLQEVVTAADAVSIVTPTSTHYELARLFLENQRHVLVEKPMTDSSEQASELIALAHEQGMVLQVGHVERFNPVFNYLQTVASMPRFIEAHRLSPFPARSMDIGVVLDLMIHDLDVVLAFVRHPLKDVVAVGMPVLSRSEDIANARLTFANGCVANLTASRISPERLRKIRVFSEGPVPCYVSLDYRAQEGYVYRMAKEGEQQSSLLHKLLHARDSAVVSEFAGRRIVREPVPITKEEPLRLELQNFIESVRSRKDPLVSGASAKLALDVAFDITRQIQRQTPPQS